MINLQDYGYTERIEADKMGLIPARVTEVHRNLYKVICQFGEAAATLKGSLFNGIIQAEDLPAVGDFVLINYNQGSSVIMRSYLESPSFPVRIIPVMQQAT